MRPSMAHRVFGCSDQALLSNPQLKLPREPKVHVGRISARAVGHGQPLDNLYIRHGVHFVPSQIDIIHESTTWYEVRTLIKQNPDLLSPATVRTLNTVKSRMFADLMRLSAVDPASMPDMVVRVPYLDLASRLTDAGLQCSGCQEHMQQCTTQNPGSAHSLNGAYLGTFAPGSQMSNDVARCQCMALADTVYLRRDFLKHVKGCPYARQMFRTHRGSLSA